MKNVPFHTCKHIKELFEATGHMVMLLPLYSPFLNPLETLFSKWKGIIKNARRLTKADLLRAIRNGVAEISVEYCCGFYRHMVKYMSQCLKNSNNYRMKLKFRCSRHYCIL